MATRTVYVITEDGTLQPQLLGTGTDIETKFLRGDGTWQTVSGGGGGGGAVDSVNGQTGTVVLDADDVGARAGDWTPTVGQVQGLSDALDGKSAVGHTHPSTDISDATTVGQAVLTAASAATARSAISAAETGHTHVIGDVTGLQTALDSKQAAGDYPLAATTPYVIKWDAGTSTWPTRPSSAVVPVGMAWFDSSDDASATGPTGALSDGSVTDKWVKKAAE